MAFLSSNLCENVSLSANGTEWVAVDDDFKTSKHFFSFVFGLYKDRGGCEAKILGMSQLLRQLGLLCPSRLITSLTRKYVLSPFENLFPRVRALFTGTPTCKVVPSLIILG